MREIKFRAWDKDNERFLETFDFIRYSNGTLGVSDSTPPFNKYGETVLMQFTGLKDKNGTDIYEGDIVKIVHPYKDREWTGEVEYDRYAFGGKGFYFTHFDTPGDLFSEGTDYIEVIGNIHENPELLK